MNEPPNPDRACDRCRERRVKCDKRHPNCFRCEKLGKPCPGYAKKRKFVDEGVTLRKKFEQSFKDSTSNALAQFIGEQTISFEDEPRNEVLPETNTVSALPLSITSNFDRALLAVPDLVDDHDELHAVDEAAFDPEWFNLEPAAFYDDLGNSCGFLPNVPNIVDEVDQDPNTFDIAKTLIADKDALATHEDLGFWGSESQLQTSLIISDEREHEMAYLIRHFSESIGPWMDLFDSERHFTQLVPLKALRDVLLKNAMAAVAAKQLGCIKGSRPFMSPQNQKPASMEMIEFEDNVDWFYKAANYYDKAIMHSRVYLQQLSGTISSPTTPTVPATVSTVDSDDLLLAVSIFSLYEYLDNADFGWIQHLTGFKSILAVLNPSTSPSQHYSTALGRRASFWNFARADYQAAYINKTPTLLDTDNMLVWLDSGLQVQADGTLYTNPDSLTQDRGALSSTNQLVAHTLLWILLQTMNYLYGTHTQFADRLTQWQRLMEMLDAWQAARPRAFQPCARLRHTVAKGRYPDGSSMPVITELFFSIPLCAATVQLYHFTRLLLLLNKPDSTISAPVQAELLAHAYTIIGIALGRPHPAVRVEMLLPLDLAGSCLKDDDERQVVVDLLQAIGKDTGCEAGGRVKELAKTWGWTSKRITQA
ncbi:hypothetical protein AMS68_003964 [Peltaster fructicola]|uniref:Zn(2)-C6 fungal-type domain-containing protein n=1 Tax=Peltaster fructicola TaxID=286661 RepID=A0A6H0XUL0_9PEZI|nr:hypothetical protein AMS68_003964 [Peltaster fructicola]